MEDPNESLEQRRGRVTYSGTTRVIAEDPTSMASGHGPERATMLCCMCSTTFSVVEESQGNAGSILSARGDVGDGSGAKNSTHGVFRRAAHIIRSTMTLFIVANSEFHSQSLLRGWGGWFRKSFPVVVVGSSSWSQFLSGSGTAFCHIGLPASAANTY